MCRLMVRSATLVASYADFLGHLSVFQPQFCHLLYLAVLEIMKD
jgi:hypothetical protein